MNLARFTVARPVFTVMVTLIALTLGGIALKKLPIDLMPDITYPTLSIVSEYGNTGPEEMEELVTRRIEEAVAAVPGVEEISSTSSEGQSSLRVSFVWGTDLDVATNDIRDRLDRIANNLPDDMDKPQIRKFDISAFPILLLGVSSRLGAMELRQLVDDQISYRIERIPGVAAVDIWGGLEREIHVDLDNNKIEALGLSMEQIRTAIQDANITLPAGEIEQGNFDLTLRTPGQFTSLDEIRDTVVAMQSGVPIYLHQIADVVDTHQKLSRIIRINDAPGIRIAVNKQSGSNTVQVAQAVKREVDRLRQDFPQVSLVPVMDTSVYIERSISNVSQSILYGGALAILVLLLFLRDWRATLVVATAIPISIITTFVLIYFGGFTLNMMTLGGLALGVGMMVDNAIVVIENIARLRNDKGVPARKAAIEGAGQVAAAVIASTITTLVIFLPMVFTEDMAGVLFRQLGYVVGFALLCSLAVSLTLIPMLASRLSSRVEQQQPAPLIQYFQALSKRMLVAIETAYLAVLDVALRWRLQTLVFTAVAVLGSMALVPHIGGEFMPATDEAEVRVSVEMEPGTRLQVLNQRMQIVEQIVRREVPEAIAEVVSVGGSSWRGSPTTGEIRLTLLPNTERDRSSASVAADLRRHLQQIAGVQIRVREGQGLFLLRRIGSGNESDNLSIELRGYDLTGLDSLAAVVENRLGQVDGITDVRLSRGDSLPQQIFRIDRARAADLGVSVSLIAQTLETAIAGSSAGQYRDSGDEFRILVRLKNAEQMDTASVLNLTVVNDAGEQVVLRNLVNAEMAQGPVQIDRRDQQRVVQVNANISGRDLTSVVTDVREQLRQIPTPQDTEMLITGDYEEQQRAFAELMLNFILAFVLVYMVMACLYESLLDPLIVMFCVPLALIGVLLALYLTKTTFNVQSFIGCIMLLGIVVNNAILIVDHATRLRESGMPDIRAVVRQAGLDRLRPVLMTSLTTILALVPLALGIGEGSEAQAPMARVVIGGLLSSTLITLVVIPVVYSLLHRASDPVSSRYSKPDNAVEAQA